MRFGIQDLMFAMIFVTMYCAVFLLAPTSPWSGLEIASALIIPTFIVPLFGVWWLRSRWRIGPIKAGFRAPRFWSVQFWFAGLTLATAIILRAFDYGFPKPVVGQLLAMHGMFLILLSGIRFGEHGVALGPAFLSWSEHRFGVEDQKLTWRYVGTRRGLKRTSRGTLPIRASECETVRRILADRQAPEDQTPMNANNQGGH